MLVSLGILDLTIYTAIAISKKRNSILRQKEILGDLSPFCFRLIESTEKQQWRAFPFLTLLRHLSLGIASFSWAQKRRGSISVRVRSPVAKYNGLEDTFYHGAPVAQLVLERCTYRQYPV